MAAGYDSALATVPGLILPQRPAQGRHAWHLYQVRVAPGCAVSRDLMIDALTRQEIGTSVHFIPIHQLSAYRRILGPEECRSVPVTDQVAEEVVSLPMYPGLTDSDIAHVTEAVAAIAGCSVAA